MNQTHRAFLLPTIIRTFTRQLSTYTILATLKFRGHLPPHWEANGAHMGFTRTLTIDLMHHKT